LIRLKSRLQTLLARLGLYQRLKGSLVYDLYWRLVDRDMIANASREVEFYRVLLKGFRRGDLIFDVGANQGVKTGVFLRLGARVVAVEPDVTNQRVLKERFLRLRMVPKPVVVVGTALTDRAGIEMMWVDEPGSAMNTLSRKWVETLRQDEYRFGRTLNFPQQRAVETTTLDQLIGQHGRPFFVKIDVEGSEANVLRGLRQPVPFVSFEVNLPEFRPEGLECIQLLGRLAAEGRFNYAVECRRGLMLEHWLLARDFVGEFNACNEKSIEVFWRTNN
jgi:FkbM family methyltransferase